MIEEKDDVALLDKTEADKRFPDVVVNKDTVILGEGDLRFSSGQRKRTIRMMKSNKKTLKAPLE